MSVEEKLLKYILLTIFFVIVVNGDDGDNIDTKISIKGEILCVGSFSSSLSVLVRYNTKTSNVCF